MVDRLPSSKKARTYEAKGERNTRRTYNNNGRYSDEVLRQDGQSCKHHAIPAPLIDQKPNGEANDKPFKEHHDENDR